MAYAEQNRKWCLGQKWRAAKWEDLAYTFGEGALVRYVDNPPLADMEGIVEYLLSADGAANMTVSGKTVHGTYRTAAAWWEDVIIRGEARVRLYHECVPAASAAADTAYVTENGCTWLVTLTPYFRQAALTAPAAGTSGISYRVMQERRDPRTGLWMFVIEKRDQKVTTTGVYTELVDAFKTVTGQAFYGVRTGDKDETGAAVPLWTPGNPAVGTLIENVSVQKNENCTRDIRQRKTVAKAVTGAEATARQDVFEKVESATNKNQAAGVAGIVAATDGVMTEQSFDENPDGTFQNKELKTTELTENVGVDAPAQETLARDLEGTETTLEHANQTSRAALPESDTEGTLVEVVNRKTKAGRFWQTVRTKVSALWMNRIKIYRVNAIDTETVEIHDGVPSATVESDFPQPSAAADGVWQELKIEERLDKRKRVEKTTHALTGLSVTVRDKSATKTLFGSKAHDKTYAAIDQALTVNDPATGTKGLIERLVMTLHEGNVWLYHKESDTENNVENAQKTVRATPFVTVTRARHASRAAASLTADPTTATPGIEVTSIRTDGDLTTQEIETATPNTGVAGAGVQGERLKTIQGLLTRVEVLTRNKTSAEAEEDAQTPGTSVTVKNVTNDLGKIDVLKVTETGEKYVDTYEVPDEDGEYTVTRYYNHTAAEEQALLTALNAGKSNHAGPGQINKFRKFDGVIVSRPARRGASAHNRTAVDEGPLTYTRVELVRRDGAEYARTWTYTYSVKQDWGIDSGYAAYDGAKAGSRFDLLGDDWYRYEKVTAITVSETAVTISGSPTAV